MKKVKYLNSAKNDLKAGYFFYESKGIGLGAYFLESLYSDIDSLKLFAGIHAVHFDKYYRMLSKRFPYAIYYQVENDEVLVFAVIDCRRNPQLIEKRLK